MGRGSGGGKRPEPDSAFVRIYTITLGVGVVAEQTNEFASLGTRRSSKNRRGRSKSTITKIAINGSRGDVLRCIIDDAGPDGEVTIHIDDKAAHLNAPSCQSASIGGW
jgi:hypothetical protein